jgi:3-methyladenine DNA glycosylase AlkD
MLQASAAVDFSGERAQKMTMASIAETIARRIAALGDPVRALGASRYFKTGPGEYGEGDVFAGVTIPQMRALVKEFWRDTAWDAVPELLASPVHEVRSAGLAIWVKRYEKGAQDEREAIYASYLAHTSRINNWDLVDISAPGIVGAHLLERPRGILRTLAKSPFLWERRIAIIATLAFIRKGEFDDTLEIAALLKTDHEDLIHKATGWMLREVGKRDGAMLEAFLEQHAATLPRTALRYAIERMEESARQRWLAHGKHRPE